MTLPNGEHATQSVSAKRPTYLKTPSGIPFIRHDLVDDGLEFLLPGSYSGGRAFSTPLAHQVDKSVPLAGFTQELPKVDLTSFVARAGTFTDDEASRVSQSMFGDRQFMVTMTNDLTLANLRMQMNNGETPIVQAIGANGVTATVTLGGASNSTLDLGAAGLTAPVTVLFPVVDDDAALMRFYCYNNNLTGSIPDLSMNTALVDFRCNANSLTGWAGGALPASLTYFRLDNNDLPQSTVDGILAALDAAGASSGTCRLDGGTNAAPSTAGQTSIDNLRARDWTVIVTGGY